MNAPAIKIEGVTVQKSGNTILDAIDLSLPVGSYTAIAGPNGAGKTTLLRCIAGMNGVDNGTIEVCGANVATMSTRTIAQQVAMVMQVHSDPPPFRVNDFIVMARYAWRNALGGYNKADEAAADRAIHLAGVGAFAHRMMNTLSGGECQKVYLAAAIAQETPILLLDEPATHLDYKHQCELHEAIRRVHADRETTILAVTHDLNLGLTHCNQAIALDEGRVVFEGTPAELFDGDTLENLYGVAFDRFGADASRPIALPRLDRGAP